MNLYHFSFLNRACRQLGLDGVAACSDSSSGDSELSPEERLAALKPPRPINLVIQPETSVVVITGGLMNHKVSNVCSIQLSNTSGKIILWFCKAKFIMVKLIARQFLPCRHLFE